MSSEQFTIMLAESSPTASAPNGDVAPGWTVAIILVATVVFMVMLVLVSLVVGKMFEAASNIRKK